MSLDTTAAQWSARERFLEIHELLEGQRPWYWDASTLRYAALVAVPTPGTPLEIAEGITRVAAEIKEKAGWFSDMRSSLRFIVGALLHARRDEVDRFLEECERVRGLFREAKLRRGATYETVAILLLRLQRRGQPVEREDIDRFQSIYEMMKRYHWWLTGPDDFPACAALTGTRFSPEEIGVEVERIYRGLHEAGFPKGDPLQTVSHLLFLSGVSSSEVVARFSRLAERFRESGVRIWQTDYDELSILSFLEEDADTVVRRVLEHREPMEALRPRPPKTTSFVLAASLAFLDFVVGTPQVAVATDLRGILDLHLILTAQQAGAAAAAAGAAAAS